MQSVKAGTQVLFSTSTTWKVYTHEQVWAVTLSRRRPSIRLATSSVALAFVQSTDPSTIHQVPRSSQSHVDDDAATMPARPILRCKSCIDCKVKCDRDKPVCSRCSRLKLECVYIDATKSVQQSKARHDLTPQNRYKPLLKRHSAQSRPTSARGNSQGKYNGRRFVDSELWSAIGGSDKYEDTAGPPSSPSVILLGATTPPVDLTHYRPSDIHMNFIWSVFVDRVDPLIKLLHIPTASSALQANESLLFAVCLLTVTSMSTAECIQTFGVSKSSLTTRYHEATQMALLNADYLRSNSIQVFTAYTMFLTVNRSRLDAMIVWILVGNGLRIAQRLGLHRDGQLVGLPFFETEMNRRLIWQYPALEIFASQVAGVSSCLDNAKWDAKPVMNINDVDIWPGMTEPPKERHEAADLTFQLTKFAIVDFHSCFETVLAGLTRNLDDMELMEEAEKKIAELKDTMETKYLRYCDPTEPLHLLTSIMGRISIDCMLFRIRLPRARAGLVSNVEAEKMYELARKIIDRLASVHSNQTLEKYRWHTEVYVIWDIVIWFVNYVRRDTERKAAAWQSLEAFCKNHPDIMAPRQAFTFAIIKLIVTAWDTQSSDIKTPAFILHLKQILCDKDQAVTSKQEAVFDMQPDDGFDWAFWDRMMKDSSALDFPDD